MSHISVKYPNMFLTASSHLFNCVLAYFQMRPHPSVRPSFQPFSRPSAYKSIPQGHIRCDFFVVTHCLGYHLITLQC